MLAGSPSTGDLEKMAYPYFFFLQSLKQIFFLTSHQKVQNLILTWEPLYARRLASIEESEKGTGMIHSPCQSSRAAHSPMAGLDLKESEELRI